MKTPIVQAWEMALWRQLDDETFPGSGADAPTLVGTVIRLTPRRGSERPSHTALPPGCVFAVRYVSR